ncbi:MAG: hypothetical protein OER83_01365, partial [Flavobacteriaceae bacterium]|nr:hypothetical protein [Flavobacteriaceae bacterium]
NDTSFTPMNTAGEAFDPSKPPNPNPGSKSPSDEGTSYQLPRYDENGDLIDSGDFPNAPSRISMSGKERTTNPYLGNGDSESKPIYDRYGHLKNPDEFPDAPEKIDVTTGFPPMIPVLDGQEQQGSSSVKQPLYDKYGNLLDAGDYPNAPLKVDPDSIDLANQNNPFTGDVSDQSRNSNEPKDPGGESSSGNQIGNSSGSTMSTSSSASSANNSSGNNNSGPGYGGGPGSSQENSKGTESGPGSGNPGPGSKSGRIGPPPPGSGNGSNSDNREGCECLKNAYERLEDRRIRFEKLRIITERMERQVGFGLSFGDNIAGIHGALGVIWQQQRIQVLKSLQSYDRTYARKYREMVADLYEILLEIDRCEAMLGYDDWYNHSGFIYYTYMKDRYKRVKTI